mmetsp:Transcript_34340/g.74941  ORF Transcript_34340/g.74941 Transcript_34340/m.74941 type:complete len:100 (+) Transcript_34340:211-510(+)
MCPSRSDSSALVFCSSFSSSLICASLRAMVTLSEAIWLSTAAVTADACMDGSGEITGVAKVGCTELGVVTLVTAGEVTAVSTCDPGAVVDALLIGRMTT